MTEGYWHRARFGRRTLLRGTALGVTGLAGAALIGCGGDDDPAPSGGGSTGGGTSAPAGSGSGTAAAGNGAPENVTRAAGFSESLGYGAVPVNDKPVIQGGTLRTATTSIASLADPELSAGGGNHEWLGDRLFTANGWTMELTPDLLESFEVTDDEGLEYILTLREGVKLHGPGSVNGRVFTAEDAAWCISRKAGLLPEGDPTASELRPIRASHFVGLNRAEAVDERTVRLTMDTPNSSMLAAFAHLAQIMYPKEQGEAGWTDWQQFSGTGAWIQTEEVDGTRKVFKANPDYYRTWDEGGRPGFETQEHLILPDRSANMAAFITGEIASITNIEAHESPQIESSVPDALWYEQMHNNWTYFAMNPNLPNLPWFADQRVRRAMQLSIDYKTLGDGRGSDWLYTGPLFVGFPEALTSDEVKALPGYNPDTKEADIAEALSLLDSAGYPEGQGITFKIHLPASSGYTLDTSTRMQEHWSRAIPRMQVEIQPNSDSATFINLANTRQFETRLWGNAIVPAAALEAVQYFHSEGSRNFEGFSEPWADEAVEKLVRALSLDERKEIAREFQLRYIEEGPGLLPLHVPITKYAYQANIGGFDLVSGIPLQGQGVNRFLWQTED